MAAHQAPPSLGFIRQEHWSGLPFPSPMHESKNWKWSHWVVSNSQRPHGLQPTRLLYPWNFPGKSTGGGCHGLLQNHSIAIIYSYLFSNIYIVTSLESQLHNIHFFINQSLVSWAPSVLNCPVTFSLVATSQTSGRNQRVSCWSLIFFSLRRYQPH